MDWMEEQIHAGFGLGSLFERGHFEKYELKGEGGGLNWLV